MRDEDPDEPVNPPPDDEIVDIGTDSVGESDIVNIGTDTTKFSDPEPGITLDQGDSTEDPD